jgi:hypothetical protein
VKQASTDRLQIPAFGALLDMAVVEIPNGGFVYAWSDASAFKYALLDKTGNSQQPVQQGPAGRYAT